MRDLSQTKNALGGNVTLAIVTGISSDKAEQLFVMLWRQTYMFEKRFSRFLPMSELSVFNRSAGLKAPITPGFRDLLASAKRLSIETGGLYNPFILPALQRAGYIKSAAPGYEDDSQEDYSHRSVASIDNLEIGDTWASIPYGTALDMGGCGKGYLADQLGETLKGQPVQGYWLSLGGDIATMGRDENGDRLTINIQSAENPEKTADWIVECPLEHSGVATSGTFRRPSQDEKKSWHHIIDPLTLKPAVTDISLATVCAGTALKADVLASCAVILGSEKAPAYLEKHGATAMLLQCKDDEGKSFEKEKGACITKTDSSQSQKASKNA